MAQEGGGRGEGEGGEELEGRGEEEEEGRGGGGRERKRGVSVGLLFTAQELHPQGDALVPVPRQDADVSGVERGLEDVLFVNVVVAVAWEDLDREKQPMKMTQIKADGRLK